MCRDPGWLLDVIRCGHSTTGRVESEGLCAALSQCTVEQEYP
jgi:hypothetical protein